MPKKSILSVVEGCGGMAGISYVILNAAEAAVIWIAIQMKLCPAADVKDL